MSFIEELRELEKTVYDFDIRYSKYDFSDLSDAELEEAEDTWLPLWLIHQSVVRAQCDRLITHWKTLMAEDRE